MGSTPFHKLLTVSALLLFGLSFSTLAMESSKNSTLSADILFGSKNTSIRVAPTYFPSPKVLGYTVEMAQVDFQQNTNLNLDTDDPVPLPTPVEPDPTCTDSDNGFVPAAKGEVCIGDECSQDLCDTIDEQFVKEYYCYNEQRYLARTYCGYGNVCQDGVCVPGDTLLYTPWTPEPTLGCSDSDGGLNLFEKGVVKGVNYEGTYMEIADKCQTGTSDYGVDSADYVAEFRCVENTGQSWVSTDADMFLFPSYRNKCEFGCLDGRCLTEDEVTDTNTDDTADDASAETTGAPTVSISVDLLDRTVDIGEEFRLTVSGASDVGLASVWWFVEEQEDSSFHEILGTVDGVNRNLAPAQSVGAGNGDTEISYTRKISFLEEGTFVIKANSRDSLYPVPGEPHQASEGAGIPEIVITVVDENGHSEPALVCHLNQNSHRYVLIRTSRAGYESGHSKHDKDFVKPEDDRSCMDVAIAEGLFDDDDSGDEQEPVPLPTPDPNPITPIADNGSDGDTIVQLRNRIRNLELRLSDYEKEVVKREREQVRAVDPELVDAVRGRILLQVESVGEAWYVDDTTDKKFYLRDGDAAYRALQAFGLGITDEDLRKIPVGTGDDLDLTDSDGDNLPDDFEEALGTDKDNPDSDGDGFDDGIEVANNYDPSGPSPLPIDQSFIDRLAGRILIQVEDQGRAWYVNPEDGRRYHMKNGQVAYEIMRKLSLGITNDNLSKIDVGDFETEANQ